MQGDREMEQTGNTKEGYRIASLVIMVVDMVILVIALIFAPVVVGSKFRAVFAHQNQTLPLPTAALLAIPPSAHVALFAVILGALVLKEIFLAGKKATLIINIVAGLCGLAFFFVSILCLFLPMIKILQKIGGQ